MDDITRLADGTAISDRLNAATAVLGTLVDTFAELAETHGRYLAHQLLFQVLDTEYSPAQVQWMLTAAIGRETERQAAAEPRVCNKVAGIEQYCALDRGHDGDCDPQPTAAASDAASTHSHGWQLRPGLGYLPTDETCAQCCQMSTDAAKLGLTVHAGIAHPATDAEQITAALDDKMSETASDGGL